MQELNAVDGQPYLFKNKFEFKFDWAHFLVLDVGLPIKKAGLNPKYVC